MADKRLTLTEFLHKMSTDMKYREEVVAKQEGLEAMIEQEAQDLGLPKWVVTHYMYILAAKDAMEELEAVNISLGLFTIPPPNLLVIMETLDRGSADFLSYVEERKNKKGREQK